MDRRSFLRYSLTTGIVSGVPAVLPAPHAGFEDVAAKSGVRFEHPSSATSQKYLPEAMGSGVAMLDYNNQGLLDLFFINGAALRDPMPSGEHPD